MNSPHEIKLKDSKENQVFKCDYCSKEYSYAPRDIYKFGKKVFSDMCKACAVKIMDLYEGDCERKERVEGTEVVIFLHTRCTNAVSAINYMSQWSSS